MLGHEGREGACLQRAGLRPKEGLEVLPELLGASCEGEGYPCEGTSKCTLYWMGELTEEQYADLCAASLLPDVSLIACVIWGP